MQNDPIGMSSSAMDALTMAKQLAERYAVVNTQDYKQALARALVQNGIDELLAEIITSQVE